MFTHRNALSDSVSICVVVGLLALFVLLASSCAPTANDGISLSSNGTSVSAPKAEIIAKGDVTQVRKFVDGNRTCYFTETGTFKYDDSGGGIWCTP